MSTRSEEEIEQEKLNTLLVMISRYGPLKAGYLKITYGPNASPVSYRVCRYVIDSVYGQFCMGRERLSAPHTHQDSAMRELEAVCEAEARINAETLCVDWLDEIQNILLRNRWPFDLPPPERS